MLPIRLCVSAILAGKKPAPLPVSVDHTDDADSALKIGPPPPKKEATPSPRDGVVWSSGYWKYTNQWFVWCAGHWELSRPGQRYVSPHWEQQADGWHFHAASWHTDGMAQPAREEHRNAAPYDALGAFR
jgi:hypothetical protein